MLSCEGWNFEQRTNDYVNLSLLSHSFGYRLSPTSCDLFCSKSSLSLGSFFRGDGSFSEISQFHHCPVKMPQQLQLPHQTQRASGQCGDVLLQLQSTRDWDYQAACQILFSSFDQIPDKSDNIEMAIGAKCKAAFPELSTHGVISGSHLLSRR